MNKEKIELFLQKINLGGTVEKIFMQTITDDDELRTYVKAIDKDGNLIVESSTTAIFEPKENLGIYDTTQFIKYLSLLPSGEIKYKLFKEEGSKEFYKISMASGKTIIHFTLSSKENIPEPSELKKEPTIHFEFKVDDKLSNFIIKSLDISGHKTFYFINTNKGWVLNIGEVSSKEHLIKIALEKVKVLEESDIDKICFNSSYLRNILSYNKIGTIQVALDGMMIYSNTEDNITTKYFQRSLVEKEI